MSAQSHRLASGSLVDRSRPVGFTFDGRPLTGFAGDTLASALLANGVRIVGRSFKYHRPRGVYGLGAEEPNALVELRDGARREPNTRATTVELYDGLTASSQNRWPSAGFDLMAVNGLLSPLFPAGFYYKTFMWPAKAWMFYERFIRRAAGMGSAAKLPDPDRYDRRHAHTDLLVVGVGPAGIAAALTAARSGLRVMVAEDRPLFGGALRFERREADQAVLRWLDDAVAELSAAPNVTMLPRTTAFGYYDHNAVGLVERIADHLPEPPPGQPRQRLWLVRAARVVLATGAIERPLVFAGNDRPGVMLASAARGYVNAYGVAPGRRAVVFANNDDAWQTAFDLSDAGVEVAAIVDSRATAGSAVLGQARQRGIKVRPEQIVAGVRGRGAVAGVLVAPLSAPDRTAAIDCDLVCASGGWSPVVHLHSQSGGKVVWDETLAAFVPDPAKQAMQTVGSARGASDTAVVLKQGMEAGAAAAEALGRAASPIDLPALSGAGEIAPVMPLWRVPTGARRHGKAFVDIQDDVTVEDVELAHREGFVSVEHLKRYTTLGMGTDQGKTSNLNGHALMAELRREPIPKVGTTTFRPPYTPVALGALAGRTGGALLKPLRKSAIDDWHERNGAVFVDAGLWRRPRYYPRPGETMSEAIAREATAVRHAVGIVDVSTLGKIEIAGPDAAELLNRLYVNSWNRLSVGRARYGVMLREDGMVFDDGTVSRLADRRFMITTTTANAVRVMSHIDHHLQVVWPELKVAAVSVTEQWAAFAVAGPRSREVLARVLGEDAVTNENLPFMGFLQTTIDGVEARVFRISFSGELAYEVNVPFGRGEAVWRRFMEAGKPFAITPYGTEALGTLRIEKGHVAGPELDGRTTADDLGLGRMVSRTKDFVGRRLLERPALTVPDRKQLVGLVPADGKSRIRPGSQIVAQADAPPPVKMQGHVTSTCFSPVLDQPIALGLLERGRERHGERLFAAFPLKNEVVEVIVRSPVFVDPEGARLHG
ncbi:MAG TPA: sarcosine oxidase subunit alpha family protein [Alphaproteobacteria bacterium]|nr:sarcosine oxidase subunit alpha family protein [Alphaproteobacteria bacterium]